MNWVAMALGILGGILNARLNVLGFFIWIVANSIWIYIFWGNNWPAAGQFMVFNVICVMGIFKWIKALRILDDSIDRLRRKNEQVEMERD